MFESFFPRPKLFFASAALWALAAVLLWFFFVRELGGSLSLGGIFGLGLPEALPEGADEAAVAAFDAASTFPMDFWSHQYMIVAYALFAGFWLWFSPSKWAKWSVAGSALIIFVVWFQVWIDVKINDWFGIFYDTIQKALAEPNSVSAPEFYGQLFTFAKYAGVAIVVAVLNAFFVSHYVFRWRTAMNDRYVNMWSKIRDIEGASQRVQEDTMRFAGIMEGLGVALIDSVMTLIAFLPILWGFSSFVKELPWIGAVPQALVIVAVLWAVFGTGLLALAGIKLPGLNFRNQRVEATFRKELVLGEDNIDRAQPATLHDLFGYVRQNYFTLYLNYLYFNVVRYIYLQTGAILPYVALAPTILAGGFTLGVMQQILRAFGRVVGSFQFLVNSWTTIVELMSIYKRLAAFEAQIEGRRLNAIEAEPDTAAA